MIYRHARAMRAGLGSRSHVNLELWRRPSISRSKKNQRKMNAGPGQHETLRLGNFGRHSGDRRHPSTCFACVISNAGPLRRALRALWRRRELTGRDHPFHSVGNNGNRCFSFLQGYRLRANGPARRWCGFYALFALFPGLAQPHGSFRYSPIPPPSSRQADHLRDVVPAEAYKLIEQQLVALASKYSPGFSVAGVISLLVALYSARFNRLINMRALNVIYKVEETRSFIRTNAIAILFTVVAIVVFLLRDRGACGLAGLV